MRWVIAAVAVAALGAVAAAVWMGQRSAEPTVVADPYEAGLAYDQRHHQHDAAAVGPRAPPRCDAGAAACAHPFPGGMVTLEVAPRPARAMRDLEFTVTIAPPPGAPRRTLWLSLSMPGMYMGKNVVELAPAGDGVFHGKGVLVRCGSGRREWSVELMQTLHDTSSGKDVDLPLPAGAFELTVAE